MRRLIRPNSQTMILLWMSGSILVRMYLDIFWNVSRETIQKIYVCPIIRCNSQQIQNVVHCICIRFNHTYIPEGERCTCSQGKGGRGERRRGRGEGRGIVPVVYAWGPHDSWTKRSPMHGLVIVAKLEEAISYQQYGALCHCGVGGSIFTKRCHTTCRIGAPKRPILLPGGPTLPIIGGLWDQI